MSTKVLDDVLSRECVSEPVKTFHSCHHAIGDTIRQNELYVLRAEILEVVIMDITWFSAMG